MHCINSYIVETIPAWQGALSTSCPAHHSLWPSCINSIMFRASDVVPSLHIVSTGFRPRTYVDELKLYYIIQVYSVNTDPSVCKTLNMELASFNEISAMCLFSSSLLGRAFFSACYETDH